MCGTKQPRTKEDVWMETMMTLLRSRKDGELSYVGHLASRADEIVAEHQKRFPFIPLEQQ